MEGRYITKEGAEKLQGELDELKNVKRQEIASRLKIAAAMGDLSENFDYQNAREEQDLVESRITEIQEILSNSEVMAAKETGDAVQMGSAVVVETGGEALTFTITGPQEANSLDGKLSAESPIGEALIGKKKGDKVDIETPGGSVQYTIKQIS
ncbi:MAG: transcription elongation factor GreA [archaeon]|nr:transcription elongation factor GreA [archaeon]